MLMLGKFTNLTHFRCVFGKNIDCSSISNIWKTNSVKEIDRWVDGICNVLEVENKCRKAINLSFISATWLNLQIGFHQNWDNNKHDVLLMNHFMPKNLKLTMGSLLVHTIVLLSSSLKIWGGLKTVANVGSFAKSWLSCLFNSDSLIFLRFSNSSNE